MAVRAQCDLAVGHGHRCAAGRDGRAVDLRDHFVGAFEGVIGQHVYLDGLSAGGASAVVEGVFFCRNGDVDDLRRQVAQGVLDGHREAVRSVVVGLGRVAPVAVGIDGGRAVLRCTADAVRRGAVQAVQVAGCQLAADGCTVFRSVACDLAGDAGAVGAYRHAHIGGYTTNPILRHRH